MHTRTAITEQNAGDVAGLQRQALELIQRFNGLSHEHVHQGALEHSDSRAKIIAKQRRAGTKINPAIAELVALKAVLDYLKAQGRL